ncbi:MAG TPA: sulfotransferase, partial [Allosphingosinicella sp.]|nr:sulfotransferase [Allosphingosinicella sp.]
FGHGGRSPAGRHVFLLGFPGAGAEAFAGLLADAVILEGCEALIDAARDWMADEERFTAFLEADDDAVEPARDAYWRRVGEEGVDPAGRLFVDCNPLNLFKLPLIARLFPDARILIVRGDARDDVLAAYAARFRMSAPAWQMLTLEGCAELRAATAALVEASRTAFGLFMHETSPEAAAADPAGEAKAIAAFLALAAPDAPTLRLAPRPGRWRDYEAELAPVAETRAP